MAATPEAKMKTKLVKLCNEYGAIVHNNIQTMMSKKGFPDVTIIAKGGATAFVEIKAEGYTEKKLSPTQVIWRDKLLAQKANWMFYSGDNTLLEDWLSKHTT